MIRRIPAGVGAALLFASTLVPALAQPATPTVADVPTVCAVKPLGLLDVLAMLNDIDDAQQTRYLGPLESISLEEIILGDPVSASDMEAIEFTSRNLVGCANDFEVMSVLALLSEDFQMRLVLEAMSQPSMDDLVEHVPLLAADTAEAGGIQAIPIQSAWYTDETSRAIVAVLEPVASDPSSQRSFLVTFVFAIDQWLIDDIQLIEGSEAS